MLATYTLDIQYSVLSKFLILNSKIDLVPTFAHKGLSLLYISVYSVKFWTQNDQDLNKDPGH